MENNLAELPLGQLGIYGIMGTSMIPLATYSLTPEDTRHEVIEEILTEFATKDIVILGTTLIKTESFDGFRIL